MKINTLVAATLLMASSPLLMAHPGHGTDGIVHEATHGAWLLALLLGLVLLARGLASILPRRLLTARQPVHRGETYGMSSRRP